MKRKLSLLAAAALVSLAAFVAMTEASPPSGVTATVLSRGTFPSFNVRSHPVGPIFDFRAHSVEPIDIVVRRHDYSPGAATGWHQHPGPIFITVTQGQLTYYEWDDPTCTPHVVTAGHGFVDTGSGHLVRNETDQPAEDISVITAPVGGAFRTELPAPNPNCGF
jgi:quercetin dioxygenase-like cupin family protein